MCALRTIDDFSLLPCALFHLKDSYFIHQLETLFKKRWENGGDGAWNTLLNV